MWKKNFSVFSVFCILLFLPLSQAFSASFSLSESQMEKLKKNLKMLSETTRKQKLALEDSRNFLAKAKADLKKSQEELEKQKTDLKALQGLSEKQKKELSELKETLASQKLSLQTASDSLKRRKRLDRIKKYGLLAILVAAFAK